MEGSSAVQKTKTTQPLGPHAAPFCSEKPVPPTPVSTCRQNRSFVTRRTKAAGNSSGRLPPGRFKAVQAAAAVEQAAASKRCRVFRVLAAAESWSWSQQRAPPPSRASQLRLLALSGVGGGMGAVRAAETFFRSWQFFWPAVSSEACSWPEGPVVQDLLSCQKDFGRAGDQVIFGGRGRKEGVVKILRKF